MEILEITKRNKNICFSEQDHKYFDEKDPTKQFISVTTLISKYEQPFLAQFWSSYKAFQKIAPDAFRMEKKNLLLKKKWNKEILKTYGISENEFEKVRKDILNEWKQKNEEACKRGTKIHADIENSFYINPNNKELEKFVKGGKFVCKKNYTDLDLEYGVYPEYLIYRESDDGILLLAGQVDLIIKKGNHITIVDHKGLPLDTPILTSTGWSTMGDLKIGDKVFDKDGNLCNVTVKSQIHYNPCYKINFDNNESIVADKDHKWLISFSSKSTDFKKGIKYYENVMTTEEIKQYLEKLKSRNYYNIPKVVNAKPLNLSKSKLPLDPYVLGVWLGDGSKSCGMITQCANSKLWNILRLKGCRLGENVVHDPKRSNVESRTIYGLHTVLRKLNLLNNKHIPDEYLLSSYEDRLQLLRGLMDTDGYYHKKRKRFVMTTSFDWQMEGMRKLVSSLGCKVSIFKAITKYNGKEFPGWNINFTTNDFNPFLCRNQDINKLSSKNHYSFRVIKSVEKVNTVPTQCIAVDSPSHTYLCTHSMIVTHNTNERIDTQGFYNSVTKSTTKMKYPLNKLDDTNFWHYTMQLSTYAWMLQKINPDFIIDDLILNHYDHQGNNRLYHCEYLKKEVEKMLAHYKKQLILEKNREKRKRIEY